MTVIEGAPLLGSGSGRYYTYLNTDDDGVGAQKHHATPDAKNRTKQHNKMPMLLPIHSV